MKSCCVYRLSAEIQKWGLAERNCAGEACRLVKLQRPPPEMRIFSPGALADSSTSTERPRRPATAAHIMPAAPAPMTTTSQSMVGLCRAQAQKDRKPVKVLP